MKARGRRSVLNMSKTYEVGELDQYLFGQGNHYEIYKKMGSHVVKDGKRKELRLLRKPIKCKGFTLTLIFKERE